MEEKNFHTLAEIIRIMASTVEGRPETAMGELYQEFENFLTEEQKIEIKQAYN
ncbi:MAG: hypothetical protein HY513_02630, partial [Candidatus Aenigmarchaeota archaeon]|nr:hypothetical protein [Candidatus Aenigmarchaeota archaeon]